MHANYIHTAINAMARWDTVPTGVINEVFNEDETGAFRLPDNHVRPS